ncbi:MAG: alpha-L-fucosidase [Bacteroidetes bacterium]|nr:alpha-L-fucosidase [Bacteroidota bacterium]
MRKTFALAIAVFCCFALRAQPYEPAWESLDRRPVPKWFTDSKFGIFIHWGVYSVPGYSKKGDYVEWYLHGLMSGDRARINYHKALYGDHNYYELADRFKAELYDPNRMKSQYAYVVKISNT